MVGFRLRHWVNEEYYKTGIPTQPLLSSRCRCPLIMVINLSSVVVVLTAHTHSTHTRIERELCAYPGRVRGLPEVLPETCINYCNLGK
jgi:hypothetical protein